MHYFCTMPAQLYSNHVYVLSNKNRTTLYIGVTNDIRRRMLEHKSGYGSAFTSKYNLIDLLFMEEYDDIRYAIQREKQLKEWRRQWKMEMIIHVTPNLLDVAADWYS